MTMETSPKYVVVTPVRDEEAHLRFTIECMLKQTILPVEWVIVNDGSVDKTGQIIDEYAARYSWIHGVHRPNRGFRKSGGGVVEAFNDGYNSLTRRDWDFIVKFDGDLSFEPGYFEECFSNFAHDAKLGVAGGVICYIDQDGRKSFEPTPAFHVRGATKIYRRACWDAIGGFWPAPGWDTMDEVKASSLGWTTRSFPDLHLLHHRPTGEADGLWKNLVKNGRANYICGYHPLFMFAKCAKRFFERPYVIGSIALGYGYLTARWQNMPQVDDRQLIKYLQAQQLAKLMGRETIWK